MEPAKWAPRFARYLQPVITHLGHAEEKSRGYLKHLMVWVASQVKAGQA